MNNETRKMLEKKVEGEMQHFVSNSDNKSGVFALLFMFALMFGLPLILFILGVE